MKLKCFPNYNYKDDKCILCYDRMDCMIEYYHRRDLEKQAKIKYKREPEAEICWETLGNKPPYCFGTYMNDDYCEECPHILDCKETTDQATGENVRDIGKYKRTGKHRKKDIA